MNNNRIREDLQENSVLSEIKKWNAKNLSILEIHTNALALDLLDNSKTTPNWKVAPS
jgi:hypothetical protein